MNKRRRYPVIVILILAIFFPILHHQKKEEQKKERPLNVLFIAVDDMNDDLGCFGDTLVQSPNIDRLASRGIAFSHAYNQFPLCSPSRSSLLTGLRPDSTRVFDLHYHFRQGLPDVVTLPQMFMQNGYYVARVGKIYHYGNPGDIGTNGLDDKASWQERYNPAGIDHTSLEQDIINYTPRRGLGSSLAWYADSIGKDTAHTDGKVADIAIRLLDKHKEEPFFLAVGFYRPHCPWVTPKKYFDLYHLEDMKVPAVDEKTKKNYPPLALASTRPWPDFGVTREQARMSKLAYFASISFVDAQVGRVLRALDSLGLRDNTLVVFWSDHGYHLGEHGLWFKRSLFEEAGRTPLVFSLPEMQHRGTVCDRLVEMVDIYPTLADLTGLTPPSGLQGVSLKPLLEDPSAPWDHPAFTQVQRGKVTGYSIRTEKWRYSEWDSGKKGTELYDEINDPHELHNLAGDPRYADVVKKLREKLHKQHPHPVTGGKALPDTKKLFCD